MPVKKEKTDAPTGTPKSGMARIGLPMTAGSVAVQAWVDMGTEAVRFVWDRLQQDTETQQAMLACTNLEEIRKIQAAFFTAAQKQYADEAAKMLDLMTKATAAGLTAKPKGRRYDDIPL